MMIVKHYKTEKEIAEACSIAHGADLFLRWGKMRRWYLDPTHFVLAAFIAYEKDSPVGSFILLNPHTNYYYYNCGIFVKENHRRLGYGKRMVEFAKHLGYYIVPWKENNESKLFYESII